MENIIKKAIEGGWKPKALVFKNSKTVKEVLETFKFCYPDNESIVQHKHFHEYFSDPLFWQALGKALGWNNKRCDYDNDVQLKKDYDIYRRVPLKEEFAECSHCSFQPNASCREYMYHALRFYKINLEKDFDQAVIYLENLIK